MQSNKQWLPMAAFTATAWLFAYVVFWLDRATCSAPVNTCLYEAFGNWIGDVVMLQWVESYQTLIAGLTAFGAGAFVWLAYRNQRRDQLADRTAERRERALGTLETVRQYLLAAEIGVLNAGDPNAVERALQSLDDISIEVGRLNPSMAHWLRMVVSMGRFYGRTDDLGEALTPARQSDYYEIAGLYFSNVDRLVDAAGSVHMKVASAAVLAGKKPDYPPFKRMFADE